MANTSLTLDTSAFTSALRALAERDVNIAAAWALNDTARDALDGVKDQIRVVFDQPTKFTQDAFMIRKADRDSLVALIEEKPTQGRRHYLKVQEDGGPRPQTAFEALLSRSLAYEGIVQSIIPGDEARLDQNGNGLRTAKGRAGSSC